MCEVGLVFPRKLYNLLPNVYILEILLHFVYFSNAFSKAVLFTGDIFARYNKSCCGSTICKSSTHPHPQGQHLGYHISFCSTALVIPSLIPD